MENENLATSYISSKKKLAKSMDKALSRVPSMYIHRAAGIRMMVINTAGVNGQMFDKYYKKGLDLLKEVYHN